MRTYASSYEIPVVIALVVACIGFRDGPIPATGAIISAVTDPSKNALQTANVVARDIGTNREASAMTDDEGRFRIVGLQPGHYIVEVTAPGFTSRCRRERRGRGRAGHDGGTSLDSATAHTGLAPTHMPGIDTTRQDFSVSLNQASFNDLPNNGRRWSNSHSWRPRPPQMVRSERSVFAASAAC